MKTINYRGMSFEVEDHFKYVATDADGEIWVYECKPEAYWDGWMFNDGECEKLTNPNNWEDSLENI